MSTNLIIPDLTDLCDFFVGNMTLPDNIEYSNGDSKDKNIKYRCIPHTPNNQLIILDIIKIKKYILDDFKLHNYEAIYIIISNRNLILLKYVVEELELDLKELEYNTLINCLVNFGNYRSYPNDLLMFDYIVNKLDFSKEEYKYIIHLLLIDEEENCDDYEQYFLSISKKEIIMYCVNQLS